VTRENMGMGTTGVNVEKKRQIREGSKISWERAGGGGERTSGIKDGASPSKVLTIGAGRGEP